MKNNLVNMFIAQTIKLKKRRRRKGEGKGEEEEGGKRKEKEKCPEYSVHWDVN